MVLSDRIPYQRGLLLIDDTPDRCALLSAALRSERCRCAGYIIRRSVRDHLIPLRRTLTALQSECTSCIILGLGAGCIPALILAELHQAELLLLIDSSPKKVSALGKYTRLACRNLFALTAPIVIMRSCKTESFLPRSVLKMASCLLECSDFEEITERILNIDRLTFVRKKK